MQRFWMSSLGLLLCAFAARAEAGDCIPCGGCSDPCATVTPVSVSGGCGGVTYSSAISTAPCASTASSSPAMPAPQLIDSGEMTAYKVVLVPKYFTEKKSVCSTEYQTDTRYRVSKVSRSVPVTEEKIRVKKVMVPKTETKTVEYTVTVPVKSEKSVEVVSTVPVWSEETETYTIKVPKLVDVEEEYTVMVPAVKDVPFTYTVNVPYTQTETRMKTVTSAVPVTKTRTIEHCVPVTTTKTVTKDVGHWQTQVVEVPASSTPVYPSGCGSVAYGSSSCGSSACGTVSSCGGCATVRSCGGCGMSSSNSCGGMSYAPAASTSCGTTTMTKRVWVPNIVTETVPVVEKTTQTQEIKYTVFEQRSEQIPYTCTTILYKPETREGMKKEVVYEPQTRTRTRKKAEYIEETRTRVNKVLKYEDVSRTETYPVVTYETQTKTKEISYTVNVPEYTTETYTVTRHDCVVDEKIEEYTIKVPVPVVKLVDVQVCKMVPQLVEEKFSCASSSTQSASSGCGCGTTTAPASAPCGSNVTSAPCGCSTPAPSPCGC